MFVLPLTSNLKLPCAINVSDLLHYIFSGTYFLFLATIAFFGGR